MEAARREKRPTVGAGTAATGKGSGGAQRSAGEKGVDRRAVRESSSSLVGVAASEEEEDDQAEVDSREIDVGADEEDEVEEPLNGVSARILEELKVKEGLEDGDMWGMRDRIQFGMGKGSKKGDDAEGKEEGEVREEVRAFLDALPELPPKDTPGLPHKFARYLKTLWEFYEEQPSASMDMTAHSLAARTFAGALAGVMNIKSSESVETKVAMVQVMMFVFEVLTQAHVDNEELHYLNSLLYLDLSLRNLVKRLKLKDADPRADEVLQMLADEINLEKGAVALRKQKFNDSRGRAMKGAPESITNPLSRKILNFVASLQPSPADVARTESVVKEVKEVLATEAFDVMIRDALPDAELDGADNDLSAQTFSVELFGSCGSGLNFKTAADIDFSVVGVASFLSKLPELRGGGERPDALAVAIAAKLLSESEAFEIEDIILTARVPIVKTIHKDANISCDVASGNEVALYNTAMLKAYGKLDSRVKTLIYTVKFWAKRRKICDASKGTLSSYAWTILVIFFCQQRRDPITNLPTIGSDAANKRPGQLPPLVPSLQLEAQNSKQPMKRIVGRNGEVYDVRFSNDVKLSGFEIGANKQTVGELLLQFFTFYGYSFDMRDFVVSVRTGSPLQRSKVKGHYKSDSWRFSIEDPFELKHDLGSKISGKESMRHIMMELRRAATIIQAGEGVKVPLEESELLKESNVNVEVFSRRCFICGGIGHRSSNCPIDHIRAGDVKFCHICGEKGHIARQCPSKRNNSRNGNNIVCHGCGKTGHIAKFCPLRENPKKAKKSRACREWAANGTCKFGKSCKFLHF